MLVVQPVEPMLERIPRNLREASQQAKLMRSGMQYMPELPKAASGGYLQQQPDGDVLMYDGLADVENAHIELNQHAGQRCCEAGLIGSGEVNQDGNGERCGSHALPSI